MNLTDIFGKQEKPVEEKKLEVVVTEAAVIADWMAYFENTKKDLDNFDELRSYFEESQKFLQSYKLTPQTINNFNKKTNKKMFKFISADWQCLGIFISALIQTSYNQGFNDFKFEKIYATNFGAFLEGKEEDNIRIKAGKITGSYTLWEADNCFLITEQINGSDAFRKAKNCCLTVEEINGEYHFSFVKGCVAEINKYQGKHFGSCMENCVIYSPNQETLDKIKEQMGWWGYNSFCLGKLPTK